MLRISQIRLKPDEPVESLPLRIAEMLSVSGKEILDWKIRKESIDARDKSRIRFIYTVDFTVRNEEKLLRAAGRKKKNLLARVKDRPYAAPLSGFEGTGDYSGPRPVIVGFGPCGMFAGLLLAEAGLKPVILERGRKVEQRTEDVEHFWRTGELNEQSNVQFGEGGAGTFSDGKLTTGTKDFRIGKVIDELIEAGADPSIAYKHMPHVGTDVLRVVVRNIREKILSLGGEFHFDTAMTDLLIGEGKLTGVTAETRSGGQISTEDLSCGSLVLALGNAARDSFEMLHEKGIRMEAKPFSAGVRIEHPQVLINDAQYGGVNDTEGRLSAAVYKLVHHCENGRGVYTFCMCPGGYVVGSASEQGGVVTNGMSYFARDGRNANSALLVSVSPEDCYRETGEEHPLAGMRFQRMLEEQAFRLGGGAFRAPVQRVGSFLRQKENGADAKGSGEPYEPVEPTYLPGVSWENLHECLPAFITEAMEEALPAMARKLRGFDLDTAVMTGVETRSSSPVRILRDPDTLESLSAGGLYPGGEGAGYAGGIVSSAVDGIRIAEQIISKCCG